MLYLYVATLFDSSQELIIALLSNAVAQFKKYKCPRMKSHLSECHCVPLICTLGSVVILKPTHIVNIIEVHVASRNVS